MSSFVSGSRSRPSFPGQRFRFLGGLPPDVIQKITERLEKNSDGLDTQGVEHREQAYVRLALRPIETRMDLLTIAGSAEGLEGALYPCRTYPLPRCNLELARALIELAQAGLQEDRASVPVPDDEWEAPSSVRIILFGRLRPGDHLIVMSVPLPLLVR